MAIKPSPDPQGNMWDFIAYYLRVWRHRVGRNGPQITKILNISESTLSRLEHGTRYLSGDEAAKIDKAWDTGRLFSLLVWYASLGHDPEWFAQYLGLEEKSEAISAFEALTVPGLLQTEDYARALYTAGDTDNVEPRLRRRIERQIVLERTPAPHFSAILSQGALEWPIGSPEIMRDQFQRLIDLSERSNFVIRVVPRTWATGAYLGLDGCFTRMSGPFGEAVYTESPGGGRLVSSPPDVRSFNVRFDRISGKALPEEPSRDLIREMLEAVQ